MTYLKAKQDSLPHFNKDLTYPMWSRKQDYVVTNEGAVHNLSHMSIESFFEVEEMNEEEHTG